ncbi:MAG: SH3 domain-containing protein [Burkholderiaceae bacterium]
MQAAAATLLLLGTAHAADYKSVGNDPAILYDAPTLRGIRIGIAPRGMPVEVIVSQNDWTRIRDSSGGLAWVEKKALVDKRTVVTTDPRPVDVRVSADDGAVVAYRVQPGVLLDLASPPSAGWVGVRHRDGQSGFVRVGSVWGE